MKKPIKKTPPSGKGGESEKQRGRDIFYPKYNTIPDYQQMDIPKFIDTLRLHADLYELRAQEAEVWAMIQMGGTIYPLNGAVSYGSIDE